MMKECILPHGIIRLHLLYTIRKKGLDESGINNISKVIMIEQSTLMEIIEGMEAKGYISRSNGNGYNITSKGNKMLGQAMYVLQSKLSDLFQEE